jgi:hypothetical protein
MRLPPLIFPPIQLVEFGLIGRRRQPWHAQEQKLEQGRSPRYLRRYGSLPSHGQGFCPWDRRPATPSGTDRAFRWHLEHRMGNTSLRRTQTLLRIKRAHQVKMQARHRQLDTSVAIRTKNPGQRPGFFSIRRITRRSVLIGTIRTRFIPDQYLPTIGPPPKPPNL